MDDLFLAEFHGYIDQKTWEIAELSMNYIESLNNCLVKLERNDGVLESYSHLRDIIEVIRICLLHGILFDNNTLEINKTNDDIDSYIKHDNIFHFVRLFPELKNIGNIDDMCFIAFLLLNKMLSELLESINTPITKWNNRISKYYHHASILRYSDFMNDFKSIIISLELNVKIKNFHIPNNWLTYFARLSLRWNNLGNDELNILIERNYEIQDLSKKKEKELKNCEFLPIGNEHKKNESSLIFILNNNKHYNENIDSSKSSLINSGEIMTRFNSINELDSEIIFDENDKTQKLIYNDNDIRDIQELLDYIWNPVFDGSIIPKTKLNNKKIVISNNTEVLKEKENQLDNKYNNNISNIEGNESKIGNQIKTDTDNKLIIENPIEFIKYKERDTKEWYLYYYNLPANQEEEILILNIQNYKCFNTNCNNNLNINKVKLNFCCFTGYFYCNGCFGNNSHTILPGLLAKYGNLTPVPVSMDSKNILEKFEDMPLININSLTAELWKSNKYLKQYTYLKSYLLSLWNNGVFQFNNKCQYKESIKRRLNREYNINQHEKPGYFSIKQLIDIAYEMLSQNAIMYSSETTLQISVRELTQITFNWRKHLYKCINCQLEKKNNPNFSNDHNRNNLLT